MRKSDGDSITILDVAERAGVSFKTVSRVINGESQVRPATREKVQAAIEALGYRPNHNARNLRAKRTRRIVLLVANPSRNYLSELQWGAVQRCQDEGCVLTVETFDADNWPSWLRKGDGSVSGVLLPPPLGDNAGLLDALREADIPAVQIAAAAASRKFDGVLIDDREAARAMTDHLIRQDHSRIGFIGNTDRLEQTRRRWDGFKVAMDEAGLAIDDTLVRDGAFTFESGRQAASALLDFAEPPTAIFASNDDMAAGVLAETYHRRLRVPDDLAIAGYDDIPLATVLTPSLTTVHQPVEAMAAAAVDLLLARWNTPDRERQTVILPHELRIRESTTGRS